MSNQCDQDHVTTPQQAIDYMNNEIIWAQFIVLAWQNADVMAQLRNTSLEPSAPNYTNTVLTALAKKYFGQAPQIPEGTTMNIVFDSDSVKNLLLPVVPNIPPGPLMMVPHGL
jgi:hypothetical protein